jgi:hypothetical protein
LFEVENFPIVLGLEGSDHPHALASHSNHDPQDSPLVCFADVRPTVLAIHYLESGIERIAEKDLFCFFRLKFVFGDVINVCVVPIKK